MHPQQKAAWFTLIVSVGTVALYLTAVPLLSWWLGRPWSSVAAPAMGVFGLLGLWGFAGWFYKPQRDGKPSMDERDHELAMRAWRTGMVAFWVSFVFCSVGAWAFMQYVRGIHQVTVPVGLFPCLVFAGTIIFMTAQSLATLHYYGWRWTDASTD